MVECRDALKLATFYSELLGWPIWQPQSADADSAALDLGEGVGYLSFQRDPDYEAPIWPQEPGRPRMMMHLDFEVSDLAAAVAPVFAASEGRMVDASAARAPSAAPVRPAAPTNRAARMCGVELHPHQPQPQCTTPHAYVTHCRWLHVDAAQVVCAWWPHGHCGV